MPPAEVLFYRDSSGKAPVLDWLRDLRKKDRVGFAKCVALVRRLALEGQALRRPVAAHLGGGIHELRARRGRVNYRILYAFHGKGVAVLHHALVKEARIPAADLRRARERMLAFDSNPARHTFEGELEG